jgi:dolichyl-phosphate-mannose--protein O-mannosyl transferase
VKKTIAALKRSPHVSNDFLIAVAIAALFSVLAFFRIGTPGKPVYDEIYYATTAQDLLKGLPWTEWTHPPLSKLFMALSNSLLGLQMDPAHPVWTSHAMFAMRLPSLIFGAIGILLTYTLARKITGDRMAASLASLLLAFDGVYFIHSRLAMTNLFEVVFILLAALGTWLYCKEGKKAALLLVGLALGCAIATRWSGLVAWGLLMAYMLTQVLQKGRRKGLAPLFICMILLPLLVYLGVYLGAASIGLEHPLKSVLSLGWHRDFWPRVWALQGKMWNFHTHQSLGTPFTSPWWSWPMMLLPPWYDFVPTPQGKLTVIWAIGNVLVWWASVPALLAVTMRAPFLTWMGLGWWIAWGLQPRAHLYMPYLLPMIPFACIAIALLLAEVAKRRPLRIVSHVYPILAIGWFAFFYPVLTGWPIPESGYSRYLWLKDQWSVERRVQQFRQRNHLQDEKAWKAWADRVNQLPK